MKLLISDDQYNMEMNFEEIQMDSVEIIDSNQQTIVSSNKKQSLIELLRATICQTIVPCSFQLTEQQDNPLTELLSTSSIITSPEELKTVNETILFTVWIIPSVVTLDKNFFILFLGNNSCRRFS